MSLRLVGCFILGAITSSFFNNYEWLNIITIRFLNYIEFPDWSATYWSSVGAIGQWVGSIATFAAVFVALKTTNDASRNRIKVTASLGFLTGVSSLSENMIIFTATNIGLRPVQLRSSGIVLPNKTQLVCPSRTQGILPANLQQSEHVMYWVPVKDIADSLRERNYKGKVNLKIFFADSHDIRHWFTLKLNIDDWK